MTKRTQYRDAALGTSLKKDQSFSQLSEKDRDAFFKNKLANMNDKGFPQVNSMNRISSASSLPMGRSIHSGFKRFPEDKTAGAAPVF